MSLRKTVFLLFLILGLSACSLAEDITPPPGAPEMLAPQPTSQPVSGPLYPMVPSNPANGEAIYAEKCAPCHGSLGMGDGPSAAELSVPVAALGDPQLARQRTPAEWFQIVTQGNIQRFMPPFTSLTDRQRWDVVAYAFTLSQTPEILEQGATLYQANCAECHGVNGQGDGAQAGSSAPRSFADQEYMASKTALDFYAVISSGVGESMPAYEAQFSEAERWALAGYVRSLSFTGSGEQVTTDETAPQTTVDESQVDEQAEPSENQIGSVYVQLVSVSGSELPENLPVTLYGFDNMQLVFSTTITTTVDGIYQFQDIETPAERAFISSVDYNGVIYGSDVSVVANPNEPLPMVIEVYETTTDSTGLMVERLHVFFDFSIPENIQVVELYIISNLSDRTVVPSAEGAGVVNFHLPEGATNLQFEDGEIGGRYQLTEDGFTDTLPIRAGVSDHQVVFAYNLPYNNRLRFERLQELPLNSAIVMAPEGVKVRGENFEDSGTRDIQGTVYQMYTLNGILANSQLAMDISGKPKASTETAAGTLDNRTSLLIGLGALGVALIVVGVWLYRRDRSHVDELDDLDDEEELEDDKLLDDPEQVMDAIIALDDLYKSGDLPIEAYQQRRAELKARLEALNSAGEQA
jgi:mono/diheme cytochrome c family protein